MRFHKTYVPDKVVAYSFLELDKLCKIDRTALTMEAGYMSVETVRQYFKEVGLDLEVIEFTESSATVELAAGLLGVEPGRIAKTMAFRLKDRDILIVAKGDARIDNHKYKEYFKEKATMMAHEDVAGVTGHPVGGVCPFGLKNRLDIYLDQTLRDFDYVYSAGGSPSSAVKISVDMLAKVTGGTWVDVCKETAGSI
jgi:prolyl-tRNA editing enzyme YbaK/EbsC (Cys-tRNA(Pro) deacylase)